MNTFLVNFEYFVDLFGVLFVGYFFDTFWIFIEYFLVNLGILLGYFFVLFWDNIGTFLGYFIILLFILCRYILSILLGYL